MRGFGGFGGEGEGGAARTHSGPLCTARPCWRAKMAGKREAAAHMSDEEDAAFDASGGGPRAAASNENLPWVEKYRPQVLGDLVSHENIVRTIGHLIDSNRLPHLLFYGPPGTGKTSTILACAQKIYGSPGREMILELNASDDRGIEVVREQIKDFASSRQLFNSKLKLVILDEADAMTSAAQFALRRVIEKYTKNTRFCLICNYLNKIIPALQSRCTAFRFGPLEKTQVEKRLRFIAESEKVRLSEGGLRTIIRLANGDMRKCINVLQATHMAYGEVSEDNVYLCTGVPPARDIEAVFNVLLNEPFGKAYETVLELQTRKGVAMADIIAHIHDFVLHTSFPPKALSLILEKLADIEHRLAAGSTEKSELGALVAVFVLARELIVAEGAQQAQAAPQEEAKA